MADKVKVDEKRPDAVHTKVNISEDLAKVVGEGPMARGEVISRLWDYIRKNGLQSKEDGRQIEPDKVLGKVVGSQKLSMFQMTAKVNAHIK